MGKNLESIDTLAGKFSGTVELQAFCNSLFTKYHTAQSRISQLEGEVQHLQNLLADSTQLVDPKVEKFQASPEIAICEMQIARLQKTAMDRELTLEETKRFDLLMKNLILAREHSNAIPADSTNMGEVSEAILVSIAAKPEVQPQIESD